MQLRLTLPEVLIAIVLALGSRESWARPPPPVANNSNRVAPAVVEAPPPIKLRGLDQEIVIRDSLAVIGQQPVDHAMLDQDGKSVTLSRFRGKPLLVNFIYTGCYRICPNSSRALRKAVNAMRERFGDDQFNVVSIGFDQPADSPMALREFAAKQSIRDANWTFLSPAKADVAAISRSFGFSFMRTPIGYDHTLQVSVLDSTGVIRQQVFGDAFGPDSLGEPLKRLLGGSLVRETRSLSDLFAKVRILCSVYDPETGLYRTDYSLYIEIAGGATFIFLMTWLALREWREHRARKRLQRA
ncbi:MAG TPA: SCO family protein [Dokdonella sp.]|jgi:protein SCO1|nr:SCO family protein [Dokdonella sp.]